MEEIIAIGIHVMACEMWITHCKKNKVFLVVFPYTVVDPVQHIILSSHYIVNGSPGECTKVMGPQGSAPRVMGLWEVTTAGITDES